MSHSSHVMSAQGFKWFRSNSTALRGDKIDLGNLEVRSHPYQMQASARDASSNMEKCPP